MLTQRRYAAGAMHLLFEKNENEKSRVDVGITLGVV